MAIAINVTSFASKMRSCVLVQYFEKFTTMQSNVRSQSTYFSQWIHWASRCSIKWCHILDNLQGKVEYKRIPIESYKPIRHVQVRWMVLKQNRMKMKLMTLLTEVEWINSVNSTGNIGWFEAAQCPTFCDTLELIWINSYCNAAPNMVRMILWFEAIHTVWMFEWPSIVLNRFEWHINDRLNNFNTMIRIRQKKDRLKKAGSKY